MTRINRCLTCENVDQAVVIVGHALPPDAVV